MGADVTLTYSVPSPVFEKFRRLESALASVTAERDSLAERVRQIESRLELLEARRQVHDEIVASLRDANAALAMEFNARASDAAAIIESNKARKQQHGDL